MLSAQAPCGIELDSASTSQSTRGIRQDRRLMLEWDHSTVLTMKRTIKALRLGVPVLSAL